MRGPSSYSRPARRVAEEARRLVEAGATDFETLVKSCLPIAVLFANRFHGRGVEYDDLVQIGNMGLVAAARRFDPSRGVRFSTYAFRHVMWNCLQAIQKATAKRPLSETDAEVRLQNIVLDRAPPVDRAAERMDVRAELARCMAFLTERELVVLNGRVKGQLFREIGQSLRVSGQMARLIERNALKTLAKHYRCG